MFSQIFEKGWGGIDILRSIKEFYFEVSPDFELIIYNLTSLSF